MVEFFFEPWKKVVIHEIVQFDVEALVQLQGLGVQAGQLGRPINWVNGIAFTTHNMKPTDEVVKEQIRGKIHWTQLNFAYLPEYQRGFVIKEGNISVPVIDVSGNALFREMSEWLKKIKA